MIFGVFIYHYKGVDRYYYAYSTYTYTWGFSKLFERTEYEIDAWSTPIFLLENE